jgi:hypothetical protein
MPKHTAATESEDGAGFKVVDDGPKYDVATAYALLSDGTVPPVIRGEDVETL